MQIHLDNQTPSQAQAYAQANLLTECLRERDLLIKIFEEKVHRQVAQLSDEDMGQINQLR